MENSITKNIVQYFESLTHTKKLEKNHLIACLSSKILFLLIFRNIVGKSIYFFDHISLIHCNWFY